MSKEKGFLLQTNLASNDREILAAMQPKDIHLAPNYSVDFYKTKATKCADCEISHEVRRRLVACTYTTLCHIGTFAVDQPSPANNESSNSYYDIK